jgi:hypothetical protein
MFGEFMLRERKTMVANKGVGFDLKKYQADFDTYLDGQFEQTMGSLIKRTEALPYFDDHLKARIKTAKVRRDFLTQSIAMMTPDGRAAMQDELHKDAETSGKLDQDIEEALKPLREELGIDEATFEAQGRLMMEKLIAERHQP